MARMHSGKKGKSGSKKPAKKTVPSWTRYKGKEVELLISKMTKDGKSASQIGLSLRDTYGIPNVKAICGKTIGQIIDDKKLTPEYPDDLTALFKKYASLVKHLDTNKKDETAKRGVTLAESKINRLVKYYKRIGKLPESWKFDADRMGFFAE